jgi:hypothetical protein
MKRALLAAAVLMLSFVAVSAKAQTTVPLQTTRCSSTGNPAPGTNHLTYYDIPVNSNGINMVSVFVVIEVNGTVGPYGGFTPNVTFTFSDGTTSNPEPLTGSFSGSVFYPNTGTLNATFSGQVNGSISFTAIWKKPSPCYRYCYANLYQENGELVLN